ncbi:MAG: T9SS type A sorting domain-containing protein [Ignavibacteriaceae bacterium]|nr:T9SS type A sorting domain-containing protein [Ignavibacteriaceae bacterium]
MYKPYDGSSWVGSIIVSDSSISPTGSQNPVVIELPGGAAAFLYAGSNGKYVYFDRQDWATGVNEINLANPDNYSLNQNYPNPFNPITKISWQSPVGSHQVLKVFDILGNEVATLVDEYKEAGNYEVDFNAASLSSGVYFYRLNTGDYVKTMKMVLLK